MKNKTLETADDPTTKLSYVAFFMSIIVIMLFSFAA